MGHSNTVILNAHMNIGILCPVLSLFAKQGIPSLESSSQGPPVQFPSAVPCFPFPNWD